MIEPKLMEWINSGEYIPEAIREPGIQSAIFQFLDKEMRADFPAKSKYRTEMQEEPWKACMVFSLDYFLRLMAMHGYTLRKKRFSALPFLPLSESFVQILSEPAAVQEGKSA